MIVQYLGRYILMLFMVLMEVVYSDLTQVTYGSTISLVHQGTKCHLFSAKITWSNGNQAVTCSRTLEAENNFYIREADSEYKGAGHPVLCGETIRLLHSATEKFVQSNKASKSMISRQIEIIGDSGDSTSFFRIDCEGKSQGQPIETQDKIRLYNSEAKGYLSANKRNVFDNRNCPRCPIIGQFEVTLISRANNDGLWSFHSIMMLQHSSSRNPEEDSKDEL
ncbi:MIR motif-containing 39-like glycosyltransferase [Cryptosporidium felis]|nr:MIR motif-containing 39-like glycosyltransferase [Cryptosporidium felis]